MLRSATDDADYSPLRHALQEHRSNAIPSGKRAHQRRLASLDRICNSPESYAEWPSTRVSGRSIRRATIRRFPYVIAFERYERHVLVPAVAHAKRRPLYWLTRTNP